MMRGSNLGILPYGLSYYDHLGASCSSSIAINTLLIGAMPKFIWSLGGFLFKHRSYSNQREHSCRYSFDWQTAEPTWGLLDRIRIIAQPLWNGLLIVSESEASKSFILSLVKFIAAIIT